MLEDSYLPRKIVTAVDGSPESLTAAKYSIGLAKSMGALVVGLHVIHLPEYVSDETKKRVREELGLRGEIALDTINNSAKEAGLGFSRKVLDTTGSVVDAICNFAAQEGAEMIVLGTRGTGGVAKLMLGSVAVGVARSARCPVLVVR